MDAVQAIDDQLFLFVNHSLSNPLFDWLMPFVSDTPLFRPAIALLLLLLCWKGGVRGRLCALMLGVVVVFGDVVICSSLKRFFARPRPFLHLDDAILRVGRGPSASMPSGHAANWFAATVVMFIYYRRSMWFMVPMATLVAFSRMYNGVHYLTDVIVGSALGASYAFAIIWLLNRFWINVGQDFFPLWWRQLPSLWKPGLQLESGGVVPTTALADTESQLASHWLRLGYVVIFVALAVRWTYISGGTIELSEDEAYQWLWSKHLALSYYSKPPLIAVAQFLGTSLWGDTAFGVRFLSPLVAAVLSFVLLQFLAREVSARAGFWLVMILGATPLLAIGATLMTIDPWSVLFWMLAMIAGWRAVKFDSTRHWLAVGLWTGLGFLSKYTALFQLLCWAIFFAASPEARRQLRRPGPYLALAILALATVPVLIWNQQHNWITVTHVASNGGLNQPWRPTLRFVWDFLGAEFALLNPVFFLAMIWASVAFWRRSPRRELAVYAFCMGAPLFLFYAAYTLRWRVLPNWIAPSILPLLLVMAVYWDECWRAGDDFLRTVLRRLLVTGLVLGCFAVAMLHNTDLLPKLTSYSLPNESDPLRRVRGWKDTAQIVGTARTNLLAEGKPVFIIGDHYGITGELSFYLPEAKAAVSAQPLVYYQTSEKPENQFYFWPGYLARKGENAIYVHQGKSSAPPTERLLQEFSSVTDLGEFEAKYHDRVMRRFQLYACRNLR
ncbi:MAG: glycosyltransferase family 39 protein [Verrucomicrobia bacterium]|nr:glycosyltransferase family 39 protein [Verrucomicrobiota bacterium]